MDYASLLLSLSLLLLLLSLLLSSPFYFSLIIVYQVLVFLTIIIITIIIIIITTIIIILLLIYLSISSNYVVSTLPFHPLCTKVLCLTHTHTHTDIQSSILQSHYTSISPILTHLHPFTLLSLSPYRYNNPFILPPTLPPTLLSSYTSQHQESSAVPLLSRIIHLSQTFASCPCLSKPSERSLKIEN